MNPKRKTTGAWIALAALGIVLGWAIASAPAAPAEETPEKPPAATPPAEETADPAPAGEKPAGEEAVPKKLTPEEIRELPILKRFEIPADVPIEKIDTILGDVKDETFGYDEPAFYTLVSVVNKLPLDLMKPDEETVPYSQLLSTPSSFRGKPVTLRGVYLTVAPWHVPVVAIAKDIPHLFTCTIREHPMEQERPVATVVIIEDPMADFKAFDNVRVKGYFYKVRKYEGSKGVGYAPMLISQRLEPDVGGARPFEGPVPGSPMFSLGSYALLAFMGGGLIVLFIVFFYLKRMGRIATDANRRRLPHRIRLRRPDQPGPLENRGPGGEGGGQGPQGGPGH
jgi:hypothetical protein